MNLIAIDMIMAISCAYSLFSLIAFKMLSRVSAILNGEVVEVKNKETHISRISLVIVKNDLIIPSSVIVKKPNSKRILPVESNKCKTKARSSRIQIALRDFKIINGLILDRHSRDKMTIEKTNNDVHLYNKKIEAIAKVQKSIFNLGSIR